MADTGDKLRDRIAAEIQEHRYWHPGNCECGWKVDRAGDTDWSVQFRTHVAQSILDGPVAPVLAAKDADLQFAEATRAQYAEERDLLLWLHAEAVHKLSLPCGSCHSCTHWAEETWRRDGRTPPDVHQYDELLAELEQWRTGPLVEAGRPVTEATEQATVRHSVPSNTCSACRKPESADDPATPTGQGPASSDQTGRSAAWPAEPSSDVVVLPDNWEDIVETHSTYVNGRCGCGALCPDRDALARHREAVLSPATPTEPRVWRIGDPEPTDAYEVTDGFGKRWSRRHDGFWVNGDGFSHWQQLLLVRGNVTEVVEGVPSGGGEL